MPHSGGRVGKGIYFASENSKSAGYGTSSSVTKWLLIVQKFCFSLFKYVFLVGLAGQHGIMFLVEVALGNEYDITSDDPSLRSAPKGFDSVVARGRTEPREIYANFLKMSYLSFNRQNTYQAWCFYLQHPVHRSISTTSPWRFLKESLKLCLSSQQAVSLRVNTSSTKKVSIASATYSRWNFESIQQFTAHTRPIEKCHVASRL